MVAILVVTEDHFQTRQVFDCDARQQFRGGSSVIQICCGDNNDKLRQFWETPGCEDSEGPLRAWYSHVSHRSVAWHSWAEVKAEIGSASLVGNCVVFNIGGNKYRLITRILYSSQKFFVLKCMTHAEYDEDKWKTDCGCYESPPAKTGSKLKAIPVKQTKKET